MNFNLEYLTNIASIFESIAVVISLFFIWYQIRQGVAATKASNVQSLSQQANDFNTVLFQNKELAGLWYSYGKNLDNLSVAEKFQYREMLVQWLILHENIFYQKKKGLLDEEIYLGWQADLKRTVELHKIDIIAKPITDVFPGSFGEHLSQIRLSTQSLDE